MRGKDQLRIVTGPVSMPLTKRLVMDYIIYTHTHTQETEGGETAARPMQTYGGVSSYYSLCLFIESLQPYLSN